jgi:carboxylesterase
MSEVSILPGAEPFHFEGGSTGILLSHGFTGSPQSMRLLGEYLAREGGFTVRCPRLPGHGTSPEDMAQTTAADWIGGLEEAFTELRQMCERVVVAGLSMGGTLTLYMAAMHPGEVQAIAPINAPVMLGSPDLAGLAFMRNAPPVIPGIGSDIKRPGVTELAYPAVPVPAIRQLYALVGVTHDLLPRITCPVVVLQSRDDHVVNPANAPLIIEHIGSADKELIWLEDSYHVATLDNDMERIGQAILNLARR